MNLLPFNDCVLKTPRILEALNEASRSLAELKGLFNSIHNQHILINAITINEAKDSSEIENIVTTHDSIYKILTESGSDKFRTSAIQSVISLIKDKNVEVIIYEPTIKVDVFEGLRAEHNLDNFQKYQILL